MQINIVLKGAVDVPARNKVTSLAYATAFGRGCQAIMQTAGRHEMPCVKVGSVVYSSFNVSACTFFSHYYFFMYDYTP